MVETAGAFGFKVGDGRTKHGTKLLVALGLSRRGFGARGTVIELEQLYEVRTGLS